LGRYRRLTTSHPESTRFPRFSYNPIPGREIRISEETLLIRARWQAACGGFPLQMWQQKKRMANAPSDTIHRSTLKDDSKTLERQATVWLGSARPSLDECAGGST